MAPERSYNWPAIIMFGLTTTLALTVLPWYVWTHDFSAAAWVWFALFLYASGLSITAGYHRLYSHRSYQAHWSLRLFYALFGAQALQNSILVWCSMHRVHHREVDDVDHDPYSARRGLWYSHMGWMLRDEPCHQFDYRKSKIKRLFANTTYLSEWNGDLNFGKLHLLQHIHNI